MTFPERFLDAPTISWVIPIISKDLVYLGQLIDALEAQSEPISEVILVCSALKKHEIQNIRLATSVAKLSLRLVIVPFLRPAGANRLTGVKKASSDWVSFLDADDLAHPDRNRALKQVITNVSEPGAYQSVILHSYEPVDRQPMPQFPGIAFNKRAGWSSIGTVTFATELTDSSLSKLENAKERGWCVHFQFKESAMPVHHAAITARRDHLLRVKPEGRRLARDEDVRLLNRMWAEGGVRFFFLEHKLMKYRVGIAGMSKEDEELLVNPYRRLVTLSRLLRRMKKTYRRLIRRPIGVLVSILKVKG